MVVSSTVDSSMASAHPEISPHHADMGRIEKEGVVVTVGVNVP